MRKSDPASPERRLQVIPGIGPSLARDLIDLGVTEVAQLRDRDPERMYDDLCQLRGTHIDRCVLYVFRCAVYYASNTIHDARLLQWWQWKDQPGGSR